MSTYAAEPIRLFVCGDVMTGRGIDQILPRPCNPALHESYVRDARRYVALAEEVHGPIPHKAAWEYVWGDALSSLDRAGTDARIVNLETSITCCDDYWLGKGIHYRMHPANIRCLQAAKIDCCCLANNHVLDWGYAGLKETLSTLDQAGIAHAGAGRDAAQAASPAVIDVPGKVRVLVFAYGLTTSGIPEEWAATSDEPGVNLLPDTSRKTALRIAREMTSAASPGDVIVASIHWGGNWGYEITSTEMEFARLLIDEGVHVVHGHSSHHVKTLEIYRDRPILYGCGDFLTDYEGIGGHESFHPGLALIHLLDIDPRQGRVTNLRIRPMTVRRFRLERASTAEAEWLTALLNRLGESSGTRVSHLGNGTYGFPPVPAQARSSIQQLAVMLASQRH